MTLEQAQERILELEAQLQEAITARDSLSENNASLARDLESARTLNQKLFERVTAKEPEDTGDEGEEPMSCEDFAKTLSI